MSVTFNPRKIKSEDDYYFDLPTNPGTIGAGHYVSGDAPEADVVSQLHEIVEEVTRKPVCKSIKKIGFY